MLGLWTTTDCIRAGCTALLAGWHVGNAVCRRLTVVQTFGEGSGDRTAALTSAGGNCLRSAAAQSTLASLDCVSEAIGGRVRGAESLAAVASGHGQGFGITLPLVSGGHSLPAWCCRNASTPSAALRGRPSGDSGALLWKRLRYSGEILLSRAWNAAVLRYPCWQKVANVNCLWSCSGLAAWLPEQGTLEGYGAECMSKLCCIPGPLLPQCYGRCDPSEVTSCPGTVCRTPTVAASLFRLQSRNVCVHCLRLLMCWPELEEQPRSCGGLAYGCTQCFGHHSAPAWCVCAALRQREVNSGSCRRGSSLHVGDLHAAPGAR